MYTMHRVSHRYSSSTTGWISTSALGKRRGVRRRGRNERLVLDVCWSFFCFPFLFLPSPTRSRGTVLFRRFYLRGNFKGDGQQTCDPLWHADDVATPTKTHSFFLSSFRIALVPTTRWTFLLPIVFVRRLLFRNLASPVSQSTPFYPLRSPLFVRYSVSQRPFSMALSRYPVTIFGQFFTEFEFPLLFSSATLAAASNVFPCSPGKLINALIERRGGTRTRHADGNSSGNENT